MPTNEGLKLKLEATTHTHSLVTHTTSPPHPKSNHHPRHILKDAGALEIHKQLKQHSMAADPPSPTRRRRLTKLLAAQIQRQRSSSSGNSSNSSIGSDPLQDYQHKLEQALFDAEHNLQVGRHQRLCPPPPPPSSLSLHYQQQHHFHHLNNSLDDDDNSLVETASVGSATASFMDSRSDDATRGIIYTPKQQQPLNFQHAGTLSPADIMRKNLIDRDRSGSPSSTVDVFQNTFDEEDYDTATNLDGTVTSWVYLYMCK